MEARNVQTLREERRRELTVLEQLTGERYDMVKGPPVCMSCRQTVRDPYTVVERRIEFRMKRKESRLATVMTGHLCTPCAEAEIEVLRPTPTNDNQGVFL